MKYFAIFLILVGLAGTAFAQNSDDDPDKLWLPACPVGTGIKCNQSSLFPNAISAPFSQSNSVAIGTIIQKENAGEKSIVYSVNVDFYLKNYQPFDLLTATLNNTPELQTFPDVLYYNSPVFNEGDLVFIYLTKNDGHYEILPESFALDKHEARGPPPTILLTKSPSEDVFTQGEKIIVSGEVRKMELVKAAREGKQLDVKLILHKPYDENDVVFSGLIDVDADGSYSYSLDTSNIPPGEHELVVNYGPQSTGGTIIINFNSKYWTPLKQFKSGIPIDEIQCKESLILVTKNNGSPACVKEKTIPKLIEREWTMDDVKLPQCTSDRTACFNHDANLCDPSGWECGSKNIFDEVIEPPPKFIKIVGTTRDQICNVITNDCDYEYFIGTFQSGMIYGNYGINGVSIFIKIEHDELCYGFEPNQYTCEKWLGDNSDFKIPSKYELPEEPRTEPEQETTDYLPATNSINKWPGAPIYKEQKENKK